MASAIAAAASRQAATRRTAGDARRVVKGNVVRGDVGIG
jgi:hypothetical protein